MISLRILFGPVPLTIILLLAISVMTISTIEGRIFQDFVLAQILRNDNNSSASLPNAQITDSISTNAQISDSISTNATNNISASRQSSQLVVFEKDLEEIRDNLAEARDALNQGNLIELNQHIDNIDRLVSIILMTNSTLTINP